MKGLVLMMIKIFIFAKLNLIQKRLSARLFKALRKRLSCKCESFQNGSDNVFKGGVVMERCYGCGRCFPVCPYDRIREVTYVRDGLATAELLKRNDVDAVEIHTSGRHIAPFRELWDGLRNSVEYLKLVAVSLPYFGDSTVSSMSTMYSVMEPQLNCLNLWQVEVPRGNQLLLLFGWLQLKTSLALAGGTNAHTVEGLKREGLFRVQAESVAPSDSLEALIGGIAYGGYSRKIVGRVLRTMQLEHGVACIEDHPDHLLKALIEALQLVRTVKCYDIPFDL